MPLDAPGSERDAVFAPPPFNDVLPRQLANAVDVPALPRAELRAGGNEVSVLPTRKFPQNLEISPSLEAACHFGTRDAVHVAWIVILACEIGDDVARYGEPRDYALVLADGTNAARLGLPNGARNGFGRNIRRR